MPYERSHGRQCIVTGCFYTEKDRYFLLHAKCTHQQLRKDCGCETVFKFHKFPINPVVRKVWVENVNRKDVNEENSRKRQFVVCTNHFIDGQPTKENPYPTLYMQEPCPNPKFVAELSYVAVPAVQVQKPGNLVKDVQYVVTKLCNIICKDEEVTEESSNHTDNPTNVDSPEDSLSARRDRRTIKKTYKARTFETEKLFNRIRFGRPENRSLLLSILRKTIQLPEVKDCSVKLHKLKVDSTVKLSEWKDYSLHCKESVLDFDIKIDSDGSFTEELPTRDHVIVKTEEDDYDTLPELEFEVDNEYCVKEFTESLSDIPEDDPIVEDDFLASPPQKIRIVASPENGQKNSVTFKTSPKFKNPVRIQFTARKQTAAKRPRPLSASGKLKLGEPKKVVKYPITIPKITSGSSRVEKAQVPVPVTPRVNTMLSKIFYAKKTIKAPVITTPSKTVSEKSKTENQPKTINPQSKIGPARPLPKQLKTKQVGKNETTPSTVQPFKISHSKHKGSVKHSANIKVIRTYSNEKDLKNNNKKSNYQNPVLPKESETIDSEVEGMSISSAENDTSKNVTSKTVPKSNVKLNNPPAISKIWTELHTHYDYTEEEEVPFSELPEIDDLTSYVVYEGEESDLSDDDDDDDEEEEEEVENELCVTDALTEEKCFTFTGLSLLVFRGLFGILKECAPKQCATVNLSVNDQMLLALMKLKLGLINADLSVKFNTVPATCGKVFSQWLSVMYKTLNHMVVWKSRETVIQEMPELFNEHSSLASCLIDIGQIFIKFSQNQGGQQDGSSSASVRKFLYAVSPDGFVIFLSQLFEEHVSDAQMFADSGIMNKFETGDTIFVNNNFTDGITLPSDITFDVLPHTKEGTEDQPLSLLSKKAVDMLKIFRILKGVITVPLNSAPHIIHTCAALSNLGLIR